MRRILSILVTGFLFFTMAFYSATFTSCYNVAKNDSTNINNGTTIQGRLYDLAGFPFPGVKVYASPTNYTTTLGDGFFSLSNISYPVSLVVKKDGDSTINIYQNLNANNPSLTYNSYSVNTNYKEGAFLINYPLIAPGKSMLIQFTSEDIVQFSYMYSVGDTVSARVPIRWEGNKSTLFGKLILITYTRNPFDPKLITSYDAYAEKSFYIDTNRIINTTFYAEDFTANPEEAIVNVRNFNFGSKAENKIYFSLAGNTNSDMFLDQYNFRGDFDFIVPKIFASNRMHITTRVPYTSESYITNNAYTLENSIITFNGIPEIALLNPALNATDVDSATTFTVNGNTPTPGVYSYLFQPEGNFTYEVWIYNSTPSFTYPDLSGYGFNFKLRKGTAYKWVVHKMAPFGNLDDYCSVPPNKILKNFDTQTNSSYFITKADTVVPPGNRKPIAR